MRAPHRGLGASFVAVSAALISFSALAAESPPQGEVVTFFGLPEVLATAAAAGAAKTVGGDVDAEQIREFFDVSRFANDMEALIVAQSGAASLTKAQAWTALPESAKFEGFFLKTSEDQEAVGEPSGEGKEIILSIVDVMNTARFNKLIRRHATRTVCSYAKSVDPPLLQRLVERKQCATNGHPSPEALSEEFVDLVMKLYQEELHFKVLRDVCMSNYPRYRALARDSFAAWRDRNAEALAVIDAAAAGLKAKWDKGVVDSQGRGAKYFWAASDRSEKQYLSEMQYLVVATQGKMCMNFPLFLNTSHIQRESAAEVAEIRRMRKEELGR